MTTATSVNSVILELALPVPLDRVFDYLPLADYPLALLKPGIRLQVPFANQQKTAVLLQVKTSSTVDRSRLKTVSAVLDQQPLLSEQDLQLLQWASHYYHHPLGEVLASAFPILLRQGAPAALSLEPVYVLTEAGKQIQPAQLKRAFKQQALLSLFQTRNDYLTRTELAADKSALKALLEKAWVVEQAAPAVSSGPLLLNPPLSANPEQQAAIKAIVASLGGFQVQVLEGVTGSGKTEVYMQAITEVLKRGEQVLVLLPEISLTPQLEQRFRQRFRVTIVSFHSKFTETQRLNAWLQMQQGRALIMLGTRSALFTPLAKPGLIILDEEHDNSFKQQEGFRFSARDVAIARAKQLNIPVLLGSATPSLETLLNVQRQRYQYLSLPNRAGQALQPKFTLLDIRNKKIQAGLSQALIQAMRETLAQGQQVLLFLNRRGFAPVQICHGCGWVSRCRRCDANLVIHAADGVLRCHHCGSEQPLPRQCPACHKAELQPLGLGTERIEQTLNSLFADKTVIRLDRDSTSRKGSLEAYLTQINAGGADIILGTQMLAKGHHFPAVTLVAILDIDSGLFSIDYRSGEKLAQMIIQVAGRAGRADQPGQVILQTRQPQHPLLLTLIQQGYRQFAAAALQERALAHLPPYTHQALFRVHALNPEAPPQFLQEVLTILQTLATAAVAVLGPVKAPMARRAGQFRYQLLLQSSQRQALHQVLDALLPQLKQLKTAKSVRWSVDVDPQDLY